MITDIRTHMGKLAVTAARRDPHQDLPPHLLCRATGRTRPRAWRGGRGHWSVIPTGDTTLLDGDRLTVIGQAEGISALRERYGVAVPGPVSK